MLDNFTTNFRRALSLVLYNNGQVLDSDIDELLEHFRIDKGIEIDREEFVEEVIAASKFFQDFEECLFVCTNVTCTKSSYFEMSMEKWQNLSQLLDCPVVPTGCHWQCEKAPVVTLKTGSDIQSFVKCSTEETWKNTFDSIQNVLRSRGE